MTIRRVAIWAIAALACAGSAAAQEVPTTVASSPWHVSLIAGPRYHLDGSRDAFSSETVGFASGVLLGRVLAAPGRLEVAAELAFEGETNRGELHQAWTTQVTALTPTAGLSLRVRTVRWLLPFVRLHVGATWHDVSLDARDGSGVLEGSAWGFQGSAGLGLMLQSGTFARSGAFRAMRFAFTIEGGSVYASPVTLEVAPRAPSDAQRAADRLPVQPVRLGALDTSAIYVRLGLGFRF